MVMRYATEVLSAKSREFVDIMTLLASLRAVIIIPREHLTVGEMKGYAQVRKMDENNNWPKLDWRHSPMLPPARREVQIRISTPMAKDGNIKYVDEYSPQILLCQRTLSCNGRSFQENAIPGQIRSLYFEWLDCTRQDLDKIDANWQDISDRVSNDIHRLLINAAKEPIIRFSDSVYRTLQEEVDKEQLSATGKTIVKFREEMLFLSPPKNVVEQFLDSCLYNPRLATIRKSLEDYLSGKTDMITDI